MQGKYILVYVITFRMTPSYRIKLFQIPWPSVSAPSPVHLTLYLSLAPVHVFLSFFLCPCSFPHAPLTLSLSLCPRISVPFPCPSYPTPFSVHSVPCPSYPISVTVLVPVPFPCLPVFVLLSLPRHCPFTSLSSQVRRQGGSRGFARTPFWPPERFYMYRFKCPTVWNGSSSLITAVKTSLVAVMRVCSWSTSAERARKRFTPMRWKNARK